MREASISIVSPYVGRASSLLSRIEEKLHELEDLGLSTQKNEDDVSYLAKRIEIIGRCNNDLEKARNERMEQLFGSGNAEDERIESDEGDN